MNSNKPYKFIQDSTDEKTEQVKSIRNIPIPTRAERAILEAEAIKEDEETAYENIAVPGQAKKMIQHKVAEVRVDGLKKSHGNGRKRKPAPIERSVSEELPLREAPAQTTKIIDAEIADDQDDSFKTWEKKHKKGYMFWFICALFVLGIFALVSSFMVSATVIITPKKYDVALNSTKLYLSDVPNKTITADVSDSLSVPAKGTVQVDRKATGRVVLYNSYSTADQKLVVNTRLETSSGKIFKLDSAVTIPGSKTVAGKKTPGSIEVNITADKSGDDYNVGFKDLKVTGYKGTERYEQIYGRTKTSIGNGYVGTVPNISQTDLSSSTSNLKAQLYEKLIAHIQKTSVKDADYVFVPDSLLVEYTPVTQKTSKDGLTVTLSSTAKATAVLYDEAELSRQILKAENIIENASSTSDSRMKYTGDISKITVRFPKDTLVTDLNSSKNVYFTVTGTSTLYSMINVDIVASAISNLEKGQALPVVQELVDSEFSEISVWPWWISKLPSKEYIKVDIR